MAAEPIHYELFIRRDAAADWTLELATETRAQALEVAQEALGARRAVGVKVSKETRQEGGAYQSLVIFSRGELQPPRRKSHMDEEGPAPLCVGPSDLYTVHARARIARLFEGWLRRANVTAFELLHRPDLVERLEANGLEIQHAISKIAVPEAQAAGVSTHDAIRRFQRLSDAAIARLLADARKGVFPDIARDGLHAALRQAGERADGGYLLGVAVARDLAGTQGWAPKLDRLLDLAEACGEHPLRPLLFHVLEQPLAEILGGRAVMAEFLGGAADLGASLAMVTRLLLPQEARALAAREPELARAIPAATPETARLGRWLHDPAFAGVAAALARRVLDELNGPRRLHPDDPGAEILTLRALARLLVLGGQVASPEEVHAAFAARSRRLVAADFVEPYLQQCGGGALGDAHALVQLAENVVGQAQMRAVGDWLQTLVGAHRFERELRGGADSAAHKLAELAGLQQAISRLPLEPERQAALSARLGEVADQVEGDGRLIQAVARSSGAAMMRLLALLRLASGEAAPPGPVTRRARTEALKLARDPATRAELACASPGERDRMRALLHTCGLAA